MATPIRIRESDTQRAIVQYIELCVPGAIVWAVPNSSRRTRGGKASNGVPGLRKGVFDLSLIFPDGRFAAIEVKGPKGFLSMEQRRFRAVFIQRGIPHCIAKSVDDVRAFLAYHHVGTREAS